MSHPRADLRAAVRAALIAAPEFEDVTLFRSWQQMIAADDRPALGVYTPRETVEASTGNSVNKRTSIIVAYRQDGGDDLDDHLDEVSAIIEPIVLGVLADHPLFGLETTDIDITGEGEAPSGLLALTFSAERYAREGQP